MSTDMTRASRPTLPQRVSKRLHANPQMAHQLPAPAETWTLRGCDAIDESDHTIFRQTSVIRRVGETDTGTGTVGLWQTTERLSAYVEQRVPEPNLTPCGHTGVTNLGDDGYTCQTDDCDGRFGREAALAVLRQKTGGGEDGD